jgi:hypothetical protein
MTSRFNPKPNVVYKRSWRGKFCPNNTQKWNSASSTQNWGGEFSIGTLGKFHPALTCEKACQEKCSTEAQALAQFPWYGSLE